MAKSKKQQQVDFPFYSYLQLFLQQEKKKVYNAFTPLTKKFLNFNHPDNARAFLRPPQFEALEMYVFLKEYCNNNYLSTVFEDWFQKQNQFEGRLAAGVDAKKQTKLFDPSELNNEEDIIRFQEVYARMESFKQIYPNYIFALTMGLGKTVLMATSIFYEFLLANKYPKDERFCHNALVFAPDKTVLQSLKEIETFDKSKVVPPEYVNWLETNLKFFFLDESGDALNAIEHSKYNIIISNTQKIILKKTRKPRTDALVLFEGSGNRYTRQDIRPGYEGFYDDDIEDESDLISNQRFTKLTRLEQLGIYVDEAHHVFGKVLESDLDSNSKGKTSLRLTINELAASLKKAGTTVVGCYNYTGTPYVGSRLLPEVVYAYGLKDAIDNQYLKKVKIKDVQNIKEDTLTFVRLSIRQFWEAYSEKYFENMLPKLALFASSIDELQSELRPAVEQVLVELNIPTDKILVNVGDSSITSNDDLREFKNLDTISSTKQFILLVNKGKEGWNCRSLFGVALHREPKSKIFVLQATMRCLRSIEPKQQEGLVFLSTENVNILNDELQENFKLTVDEINSSGRESNQVQVKIVEPIEKIKLKKVRRLYKLKDKKLNAAYDLELDLIDVEKYKILVSERNIKDVSKRISLEDQTEYRDKREFSTYTLSAEIARYLNLSPIRIKQILESSKQGIENVTELVNEYNAVLYDWIIPKLFNALYEVEVYENKEEIEVELIKRPEGKDYYEVSAKENLLAVMDDDKYSEFSDKTFHVDKYCFDSNPENNLFWTLLHDGKIDKVWFTGMFTHGQTDFVIHYIDPNSHTVRSYYPDFLVKMKDGSYQIIEVKGDHMIDDEIVLAKSQYATQMAAENDMVYKMVKGSDAMRGVGVS